MWGESLGWGSNVPLSLGCVVLEHLPGESLKPPNVLFPFQGSPEERGCQGEQL